MKPDLGPRYERLRLLGRGSVGEVHLVRDRHLETDLALKLLARTGDRERGLEEFRREFALLSAVEHPGVARAYDFGYVHGVPFFTTEYIGGETLAAKGVMEDPEDLLRLARELTDAVSALHVSRLLHLDIKPSNVIVDETPGRHRTVLIDFGLVRRGGVLSGDRLRGSLPFMAPERFRNEAPGPWTDVYALGVTLYRAATGRYPRQVPKPGSAPEGGKWVAVPRPPSSFRPVPPALDEAILRCLALDPVRRFADAGELLHALGGPSAPRGASGRSDRRVVVGAGGTLGREEELRHADRFFRGLVEAGSVGAAPAPVALLITGSPGMGQTHLMREMKVRAQTRGLAFYLEELFPGSTVSPGSILRCLAMHLDGKARSRWNGFLTRLRRPRPPRRLEPTEGEMRLRHSEELAIAIEAVRGPLVIAVDGLQHADEVSVGLIVDLVRDVGQRRTADRPPIGVVAGYREEGRCARELAELTEYLLKPQEHAVITLRPLGLEDTLELHRRHGGTVRTGSGAVVFQETGGSPREIVVRARAGVYRATTTRAAATRTAVGSTEIAAGARVPLLVLALVRRPATAAELARITKIPRPRIRRALLELANRDLVVALEGACWSASPAASGILDAARPAERARWHRRIAEQLSRGTGKKEGPWVVEAARHWRAAGNRRAAIRSGLAAAHYLRATFQHRAALEELRTVADILAPSQLRLRVEVALGASDLEARLGALDEGIRSLGELLALNGLSAVTRARILLRLATLHCRRGDFRRAAVLFGEGFRNAHGHHLPPDELLLCLNEQAAMRTVLGEHDEAVRLCSEGLRAAARSRKPKIRELALNLHATRANGAMRRFDYEAARRDLEMALGIAESIGSPANQAVVLNNLGVVYTHLGRYAEAIRTFRQAERTSRKLDEGPSLVSVHANLAVLYARTGEFQPMEEALAAAETFLRVGGGQREKLFLRHAAGLAQMYRGRYFEARPLIEEAAKLAEHTGDAFLAAFDRLYRAECLVLEGDWDEASGELRAIMESSGFGEIRRSAAARYALVAAFRAAPPEAAEALKGLEEIQADRTVPLLEAWNDLLAGWACSVAAVNGRSKGEAGAESLFEEGEGRCKRAERVFRCHGAVPAVALASWVRAESRFLQGRCEEAEEILEADRSPGNDLTAALRPLLAARILLEEPESSDALLRCGDLLAEAGTALAQNPLREWRARLDALRVAVGGGTHGRNPETARPAAPESGYWRAWTDVRLPRTLRSHTGSIALRDGGSGEDSESSATAALPAVGGSVTRGGLVMESPPMQRLATLLDRVQRSELPVLVCGETGSGKELVARLIHQESRRAAGRFLVLDCAAIPSGLAEVELFGARVGSFTDLGRDREGLLSVADGGTVLLDEIAGLVPEVQRKVARVLERGTFRRIGDEGETRVDVRFVFTTSRDLEAEMRGERLYADLLHRIRVLTVAVPPLRERPEDVLSLVRLFLAEGAGPAPDLDTGVIERLQRHSWPGNVRELRNLLARLRIETPRRISVEDIERAVGQDEGAADGVFPRNLLATEPLGALKERLEREYVLHHFHRLQEDTRALSRFLGITREQLYRRTRRLKIRLRQERRGGSA